MVNSQEHLVNPTHSSGDRLKVYDKSNKTTTAYPHSNLPNEIRVRTFYSADESSEQEQQARRARLEGSICAALDNHTQKRA